MYVWDKGFDVKKLHMGDFRDVVQTWDDEAWTAKSELTRSQMCEVYCVVPIEQWSRMREDNYYEK